MDTSPITTPSGVLDFLRLPFELRNLIYSMHLSRPGEVCYQVFGDSGMITCDKPMYKLRLGVNILRVCRQIYDEAVTFAYADRKWALGEVSDAHQSVIVDCTKRLDCIPYNTAKKIELVELDTTVNLWARTNIITSVAMGDLSRFESLRAIQLNLILENGYDRTPSWLYHRGATLRNAPLFIGLVCQILSQIPTRVREVVWKSSIWDEETQGEPFRLDPDLLHIAQKYSAIKGCGCKIDESSAVSV